LDQKSQRVVAIPDGVSPQSLFGSHDAYLKRIRDALSIQVVARNGVIKLIGKPEAVERAEGVLDELIGVIRHESRLRWEHVETALDSVMATPSQRGMQRIPVFKRSRSVHPKTAGQQQYVEAIDRSDLVFCIGPAGTGKTYLAVAKAVAALREEKVDRIALVRPAVEAGEKLGFLPGDLEAKVNPYLRPLYDALHDMMDPNQIRRSMDNGVIEVIPLAFMRGRTLGRSFVILDEAQNCTIRQMKMFLTRIGLNSGVVVTGDVSQGDLPEGEMSGLIHAEKILKEINEIEFVYLDKSDIVRHPLVQFIVEAFERDGK
jgi:phosphate starvation-inducible PhoH-like protein